MGGPLKSTNHGDDAIGRREQLANVLRVARQSGASALDEPASKRAVAAYGLPIPDGRVVADVGAALAAFDALRPPVVVKLIGAGTHKTDIGGVRLNLQSAAAVRDAYAAVSWSRLSMDCRAVKC